MNSKIFSVFAAIAIALVATSSHSIAAAVSPSEFNTQLKEKIGTKTGLSAANAAASLLGKTLKDKANTKNAEKYAKSVVKALKKPSLSGSFAAKSINACVKQLLAGYFTKVKFNLDDKIFNKAYTALLKGLPPSAKVSTTSQMLYNTITNYATKKGATQPQIYAFFESTKGPLPPPPDSL